MFCIDNNDIICQCCLKSASSELRLVPIDGANVEVGKENKKIYELFNTFADDLGVFRECQEGSMICGDCLQQLINTANFYQKCVQSQTLIRMKRDLAYKVDPVREYISSDNIREVGREPTLIRIPTPPVVYRGKVNEQEVSRILTVCSNLFPENKEGILHVPEARHDTIVFEFECFKCVSIFKTQLDFLVHMSEEHEVSCIPCETCGAVFDNTVDSDAHRLKHYIQNDPRFSCEVCSAQYPTAQALQNHSTSHRDTVFCQICLKPHEEPTSLISHLYQHFQQRVLPCIYCALKFCSAVSLNEHIAENHDDRRFGCSLDNCRERFSSKDLLRKHQLEKHDKTRLTYDCKVCKEIFDEKSALTNHLETHLNRTGNSHSNINNINNNRHYYHRNYHHKQGNQHQHQQQDNVQRNNNNNNAKDNNNQHNQHGNNRKGVKKPVKRLSNNKGNVHSRLG